MGETQAGRERGGTAHEAREAAEIEAVQGAVVAVPLVEEVLRVGKRAVETGGVRVTTRVEERQETVDVALLREEVEVERVPINRQIDAAPAPRQEGDTLVIPVVEEVLVVEKRLVLREELRVRRRQTETRDPQTVTLRREVAEVERFGSDPDPAP